MITSYTLILLALQGFWNHFCVSVTIWLLLNLWKDVLSLPTVNCKNVNVEKEKGGNKRKQDEIPSRSTNSEWDNIQEVIDSDFLISPGDIYPNRKVELEDTQIKDITQTKFDQLCNKYDAAFSKNNRDIGTTQLIEMEIDTGDSPPIAQSPYTLPLKHYDWVKKEIETLEKAGVIIRSLSPWASPVIVVPKKSAPDKPPRRRLCVDYRRLNALQQEVKTTTRGTGCLSLYPLLKIDEMLAKIKRSKGIFRP